MTRFSTPEPIVTGLAVLAGLAALGLSSLAMASLAQPRDYKARLAVLEQSISEIEKGAPGQRIAGFNEKTLCRGALIPTAASVRSGLVRQAAAAGLTLKALESSPGMGIGQLSAIDVAFTAEGPYEGAVKLIGALETARPEVFVDGAEMSPRSGQTRLTVKGRAFCWNSARR